MVKRLALKKRSSSRNVGVLGAVFKKAFLVERTSTQY
jgi:hypothetical protein